MKLGLFSVNEGGKFTGENKLEADFGQSKKIGLTGESQEGKSTGLECFKIILGCIVKKEVVDDLVNKMSGTLDIEQRFQGNDKKWYLIRKTKSSYYVREEGTTENIGEPKTFVEKHLGKVATDPMKYKNQGVDKFIKWLAGFTDMGEEGFEKEYNKEKEAGKKFEDARAAANKEAKARLVLLQDAGYIGEDMQLIEGVWTVAEEKYKKKPDVDEVSARLDKASTAADKYLRAEEKLKGHKLRRITEDKKVTELRAQLKAAEETLAQTDKDIEAGEQYLTANKADKTKYDTVKKEFENISKSVIEYNDFQAIKSKKDEMYQYEDIAQKADANAKAAEQRKKEIMWKVIPDIRGAELLLEDEAERKADFYVDGFNRRQQSATQYLTAIVKILDKIGCRILILDDVATYGKEFRELLDKLAGKGWYILYSLMKIDQELEIEYA